MKTRENELRINKIIKQLNEIAIEANWGAVDRVDGKPKAVVVIANAIAEITRLEKALEQAKKQDHTKPMTNREWLESLSDEELAKFMLQADRCQYCATDINQCALNSKDCIDGKCEWLKAEHEED